MNFRVKMDLFSFENGGAKCNRVEIRLKTRHLPLAPRHNPSHGYQYFPVRRPFSYSCRIDHHFRCLDVHFVVMRQVDVNLAIEHVGAQVGLRWRQLECLGAERLGFFAVDDHVDDK